MADISQNYKRARGEAACAALMSAEWAGQEAPAPELLAPAPFRIRLKKLWRFRKLGDYAYHCKASACAKKRGGIHDNLAYRHRSNCGSKFFFRCICRTCCSTGGHQY
jgi:hypothetical protein